MKELLILRRMSCVCSRVVTVIVVMCVVKETLAESEDLVEALPYSDFQLNNLASDACYTFFLDYQKADHCLKIFRSPKRVYSLAPPKVRPLCRSNRTVTFAITPSSDWNLVILVPPDDGFIQVKIVKASEQVSSIEIPSPNSTLWSAALNEDGTPGVWLRGPELPLWKNESFNVEVEGPRFNYKEESQVEGLFEIVFTGDITPCTEVGITNSCEKRTLGDLTPSSISFQSSYQNFQNGKTLTKAVKTWKDSNIPVDGKCKLTVWKGDEKIVLRYNSTDIKDNLGRHEFKQEIQMHGKRYSATHLKLDTIATDDGWTVVMRWIPPRLTPDKYIITLSTAVETRTEELLGNKTEFMFNKVNGTGVVFYNVTITTITTNGKAVVNKWPLQRFPEVKPVTNIHLDAVEFGIGWDIHMRWNGPTNTPAKYNLTLRSNGTLRTISLSGSQTSYTFKNVLGEPGRDYIVYIEAITPRGRKGAVARAKFPERVSHQMVIMTGSWALVLTLLAASVGIYVWWRRRQDGYLYFPGLLKIPKDIETCIEGCMEDSWEVCVERLKLKEVIGEGAFGVVRKGILEPGGREVAVKMLKDFPSVEEIRSFRAEMELMKSVGAHPHIVSLVGCCSGRRPRIVAEYCSRGDLLQLLRYSWDVIVSKRNAKYYNNNLENSNYRNDLFKNQKDPSKLTPLVVNKLYDFPDELTPSDLLSFCRQIAMGMEFLASNRVVHRDLAARNILVTSDRTLKIADFGLSRDIYQENQYKQKGNGKLPIKWMALESLTNRVYTTQSDVWSFGVVVWEVVTVGGSPYPEVPTARLPRLLRAGYRMPRPNNCSDQLYDVMMSCWRARPRDRPTFTELHRKLDELLNSACADEYLTLELDDEAPPTPKSTRYIKKLLRGNRVWARGESYEWPLKKQSNYYTAAPAPLAKPQPV